MHRLFFGYSFAELVALILLPGLAFYFLNKKKANVRGNAEDADSGASGSLIAPVGTNSAGSSSTPTETNNSASSSSTAPSGNHYEVFLRFSGKDTRESFTDHLYSGLVNAGICNFRDDNELQQGKKIGPDLFAAIKNSKILIPILSLNYGTSSWCLDELVQIMECKKYMGHLVLPIFYKVEPAHVGHQIGSFGDEFKKREKRLRDERRFDPEKSKKWKEALNEVSALKGWTVKGSEAELIKSIVQHVLIELNKKFDLVIPESLVGIDSHVKKVMEFVDNNSHAPLFVVIHGMGGIGKTTLAKTIYNQLSNQFEYCSFIADIRETSRRKGLDHLQNQLISNLLKRDYKVSNRDEGIRFISSNFKGKKVLIFLDDLDDDDQLKALAGNHNWFFSGSVIIITTRNKRILDNAKVDRDYELQEMDENTSSILFCRHAFGNDAPPTEFEVHTRDAVFATKGLPLSLEVLGSFLLNKKLDLWKDTINKLRKVPLEDVQKKLIISYDALDFTQKQIFLDIACFFIGTDWRIASYMWDTCDFYPIEGIEVLRSMSLIKIGDDHRLKMHDQLRDLGRWIVREENENEPRYRSRLWDSKEILEVLEEDEGTKKIEAIYLRKGSSKGLKVLKEDEGTEKADAIYLSEDSLEDFGETIDQGDNILTGKQFEKLRNLTFLDASGVHFIGDFENSIKKLKWLQWEYCPSTFEANNFHVKELRVLNLERSKISDEWQGWSSIMVARKLKYLDLKGCGSLEKTSFLSAFANLEVLILAYCDGIVQIDSSIGNMKSLVRLDLTGCKSLERLPAELCKLEALEQLLLKESGIRQLPESIGDLQNLEILNISDIKIKELPNGIGRLRKLQDLDASYCGQLGGEMPKSIHNLSSLQRLRLFNCKKLQSLAVLPSNLTYLDITCQSRSLPSLSNLTHLKNLYLSACEFLECIWEHPSTLVEKSQSTPFGLEILDILDCKLVKTLEVSQFIHLRSLSAYGCDSIQEIRGLDKLKYLESLKIKDCASIKRFDLPKSEGLKILMVRQCGNLVEMQGLDRLEFLEEINIYRCYLIERLDLPKSKSLKVFNATRCVNLVEIQGLDRLESLKEINISRCTSIQRLNLPKSESLKIIHVEYCNNLFEIQGLDKLEFLDVLNMSGCTSFGRLPDLCCFDTLHELAINCCHDLRDIQSLEKFPSCTSLRIGDHKSLAKFPNLSNFRNLRTLFLSNCHELREIPGLEESTSLERIAISKCPSIEILPDLSSCTNLISLDVQDCEKLSELRGLKKLEQLAELDISGCKSLKTIPELSRTRIYRNHDRNSRSVSEMVEEFDLGSYFL